MAHDFSRNLILTKLSDKYGFSFYCLDRSVLVATKHTWPPHPGTEWRIFRMLTRVVISSSDVTIPAFSNLGRMKLLFFFYVVWNTYSNYCCQKIRCSRKMWCSFWITRELDIMLSVFTLDPGLSFGDCSHPRIFSFFFFSWLKRGYINKWETAWI